MRFAAEGDAPAPKHRIGGRYVQAAMGAGDDRLALQWRCIWAGPVALPDLALALAQSLFF